MTDFLAVESLRATLINGKLRPRLATPPGQVERWRMVYAGSPDEMGMKLHVAKDASCSDFDKTPIETTPDRPRRPDAPAVLQERHGVGLPGLPRRRDGEDA